MTLHLTNPTRRLIITLLAVFSIVATALPTAFLTPAFGDHFDDSETLLGGFEIDGDFRPGTLALTPPGGKDWTDIGTVTAADDLDAPNDDLIDGKENDPSAWSFHTGTSNPAKNDILRTFFASGIHDERPFVYLGYEYFDAPGQGASTINFELNQNTTTGGAIVAREPGDLLITYDYPGGEAPVEIETFKWNGSAWIASTGEIVAGDVNGEDRAWPDVAPFNMTSESTTVKAQHFGEVAVDLRSVVGDDCITVGSAWSKTRTSGSNPLTSELTDYIKPINVPPINTCGSIEVEKEDEDGNLLDGATFELWMDDGDPAPSTGTVGTLDAWDSLVDTCATGETGQDDGTCLWDDLEPGKYWVIEVSPPDLYTMGGTAVSIPPHPDDLDETARTGVVHPVTLASLQDYTVPATTFVNPKVPFQVTVEPQDTNLIGQSHEFIVTLRADLVDDGDDGPGGDNPYETAVGGEDLDLDWSGPAGSSIIQVVDDDGTASGLDTDETSCTTRATDASEDDADTSSMDEESEDEIGTCVVTVNSTDGGNGTLTATYSPAYQHYTTDDDVSGSNHKTWLGYSAEVEADGVNLAGDEDTPSRNASGSEHTFTITAYETDGDGDPDAEPVGGVEVGFVWTGTGSVVSIIDELGTDDPPTATGGVYTCETRDDDTEDDYGTCDAVVDSNAVGSGEIVIAHVDAGSNVNGISLIDYDMDGEGEDDDGDLVAGDAQKANKTWLTYDALVSISATNLVDEDHDFIITAHQYDGEGDPDGVAVDAGVVIGFTWTGDGSVTGGATETATAGTWECTTASDGSCTVTVNSSSVGDGTLTTVYVNPGDIGGPDDGDDVVTLDTAGESAFVPDGDSATKTWIDFNVVVGPDAENLVGEDHTFFIEVSSTDSEVDLNGHTVNYTWLAPDAAEAGAGACVTESAMLPGDSEETDGTCQVTVDSDVTGQGTITIVSLVLTEGTVDGLDSTVEFDVTGETGPAADTATKTWVDYQVSVSPETAENLTGSNHVFTVLVERDSGDGNRFQPLEGAFPALEITGGPGTIVAPANLCASVGTQADGTCTVTITSAETGTTTVQASFLGGAADSESVTFESNLATKVWIDYLIDVDPDRAVNPVGTTHTFTVTLQRIEDGVASAAAGESVELGIIGPGDIIEVPGGTIDSDARGGSCTTDTAGQCDVTIASDDVGDTTLTATYDAVVGESTGTSSDSGLKLWRSDPAIELIKDADIEPAADGLKIINCNEDGCPETTFTFTVTNVGGVALHDVALTDDKFGPITLADTELAVGESTTGTATYVPSREEIDAGTHENLGTATGVSPDGQTVRDTDPEVVDIIEVLPLPPIERPEPAPEPAPLPRTGAYVAWLTAEALLALLLGWAMVWIGRTRKHEDPS